MLNNFVADVLAHEYGHGILDKPGFERIKEEAIGTNINELFGNNPATPHVDQPDLSNYEKEEIFNELLDLQRGFRTSGRFSGILASKNPTYMNWKLNKFMKNKPKWGSAEMDYVNLMSPVADKYFAEVERQGGQNPSAQSFRSAPGGLTQAQSRAARGDPKGTGGGWKWADGGRVGFANGELVEDDEGISGTTKWQKFLSKITRQPYRGAARPAGGYTPTQLNQMNALGGYYSEPARAQRQFQQRGINVLNRAAAGKAVGNVNKLLGQYGYSGTPGSGTLQFRGTPQGDRSQDVGGYTRDDRAGWSRSPFKQGGLATMFQRRQ